MGFNEQLNLRYPGAGLSKAVTVQVLSNWAFEETLKKNNRISIISNLKKLNFFILFFYLIVFIQSTISVITSPAIFPGIRSSSGEDLPLPSMNR